jgi:methionine-rich copper-binding protein CopC
MSRIIWDAVGARLFETGVNCGVLYKMSGGAYGVGVPWNGLTAITESPSGAEPSPLYADNIKYLNLISNEEFGASVEAYTYPDEFGECDGSAEIATGVVIGQQTRKSFGLVYKTTLGNDEDGNEYGYKLHIIYGAQAAPSEKAYASINDTPEAITFSWDITTTPVEVSGQKPTATVTIDSTKVDPATLATLEDILYGTEVADPRLPLPAEIAALFAVAAPSALSLSSIVPADDAANIAVDANIVITFNNAIASEYIVVTSAAGAIIAGAKTWDATAKILTFNPTVNLTAGTTYIVTIAGVVDIYSQSLAAVVKNFATAA